MRGCGGVTAREGPGGGRGKGGGESIWTFLFAAAGLFELLSRVALAILAMPVPINCSANK